MESLIKTFILLNDGVPKCRNIRLHMFCKHLPIPMTLSATFRIYGDKVLQNPRARSAVGLDDRQQRKSGFVSSGASP